MSEQEVLNYEHIILAVSGLLNILRDEIQFMQNGDLEELKRTQKSKAEFAEYIQKQERVIASNPELVKALSSIQKDELRNIMLELNKVAKENDKTLRGINGYFQRLIKVVSLSMQQQIESLKGYNKSGKRVGRESQELSGNISVNQV